MWKWAIRYRKFMILCPVIKGRSGMLHERVGQQSRAAEQRRLYQRGQFGPHMLMAFVCEGTGGRLRRLGA